MRRSGKLFHREGKKREYQVMDVDFIRFHDQGGDVEGGDVDS